MTINFLSPSLRFALLLGGSLVAYTLPAAAQSYWNNDTGFCSESKAGYLETVSCGTSAVSYDIPFAASVHAVAAASGCSPDGYLAASIRRLRITVIPLGVRRGLVV